jgi:murein L,D-transpeptidase YafK
MKWSLLLSFLMIQTPAFKETQRKHVRVEEAYKEKEAVVKTYFKEAGISYNNFELFIRAFKKERILEVWARSTGTEKFSMLTSYEFCASSGELGPKRKEGDYQIPEGFYVINHFNPQSNFHLSLGINYPNASDKLLSDQKHPGGAIYIHGNCVTVGCIPITDDKIKELYIMAVEAKSDGQKNIPVHIFPARLDEASMQLLKKRYQENTRLVKFWSTLQPFYLAFENTKQITSAKIDAHGNYY